MTDGGNYGLFAFRVLGNGKSDRQGILDVYLFALLFAGNPFRGLRQDADGFFLEKAVIHVRFLAGDLEFHGFDVSEADDRWGQLRIICFPSPWEWKI